MKIGMEMIQQIHNSNSKGFTNDHMSFSGFTGIITLARPVVMIEEKSTDFEVLWMISNGPETLMSNSSISVICLDYSLPIAKSTSFLFTMPIIPVQLFNA